MNSDGIEVGNFWVGTCRISTSFFPSGVRGHVKNVHHNLQPSFSKHFVSQLRVHLVFQSQRKMPDRVCQVACRSGASSSSGDQTEAWRSRGDDMKHTTLNLHCTNATSQMDEYGIWQGCNQTLGFQTTQTEESLSG